MRASDRAYSTLRDEILEWRLAPGTVLAEVEQAARLGVSRTPVREALTRLATDGFLVESRRGYMRKPLDIQETVDLYEARSALELECLRLAVQRADASQVQALSDYLSHSMATPADAPVEQLVDLDEGFHLAIARMAGNGELVRMLDSLNQRIRFIRWIAMADVGRPSTQQQHLEIAQALRDRDADRGRQLLATHIGLRRDQIVTAVTKGLAQIYLRSD